MTRRPDRAGRARSLARKFALQALYQWQMTGQDAAELCNQYSVDEGYTDCDAEYFRELVVSVTVGAPVLDEQLGELIDRPVAQLDPIEHALLLIGLHELRQRLDIPYRVVINEGVELAKRFGATDGHKFVNAVLDRAARTHRAAEQGPAGRARA